MKAFGYTRVSTEEQTKGYSLEAQKRMIEDYCYQHNIKLIKFFEDHTSGANIDRIELKQMLEELDFVDAVIVWRIDRLSRSVKDTLRIMEIFEEKGKDLISITEPFLSVRGDSQSRLMLHIFSSFAQYERDLIRERTLYGKLEKAKKGLVPAGKAPYGYKYENHQYKIIEEEAKVVKLIFKLYKEYKSIGEVVRHLNKNGYRDRENKFWNLSRVNKILRNEVYKGIYVYNKRTATKKNGHWIKPKEEWVIVERKDWAIIDEELFNEVQEILNLNKTSTSKRLGTGKSLFGGFIECGVCGRKMVVKSTHRKTPYYRCKSYDERIPCDNDYVFEPFLEEASISIIKQLAEMDKKEIYKQILKELENDTLNNQLKFINKEKEKIQKLIKLFTNEFEKYLLEGKEIPSSLRNKLIEYEEKLKKLEVEEERILIEKQKTEKEAISWKEFIEMLKDIEYLFEIATREEKKLLYKSIFEKIIFTRGKVKAYIKGREFELPYKPRLIDLTEEEKKLLQQINTVRAKIVLMASEVFDKNVIAQKLNTDNYTIDYSIKAFKDGNLHLLKIDKPAGTKLKFKELVESYIKENNIDIDKISGRELQKRLTSDLKVRISQRQVLNILYLLGKKRNRRV